MDVLKEYDWKQFSDCRKFIIDIILHTDMAKHFSYQTGNKGFIMITELN
jgi:hypothetical protein